MNNGQKCKEVHHPLNHYFLQEMTYYVMTKSKSSCMNERFFGEIGPRQYVFISLCIANNFQLAALKM